MHERSFAGARDDSGRGFPYVSPGVCERSPMRAHLASTIVLALTALAGCQGTPPAPTAQPAPAPTTRPVVMDNMPRPEPKGPVVHLDVYQMAVPRGAVSRSAEFWKRVDEQQI